MMSPYVLFQEFFTYTLSLSLSLYSWNGFKGYCHSGYMKKASELFLSMCLSKGEIAIFLYKHFLLLESYFFLSCKILTKDDIPRCIIEYAWILIGWSSQE